MAAELKPHGVAAVAITPGFLRSETMLEHFGVTETNWRDAGKKDPNFLGPSRRCSSAAPSRRSRRIPTCSSERDSCSARGSSRANTASPTTTAAAPTGARTRSTGRCSRRRSSTCSDRGARVQLQWLNTLAARTESFSAKVPGS